MEWIKKELLPLARRLSIDTGFGMEVCTNALIRFHGDIKEAKLYLEQKDKRETVLAWIVGTCILLVILGVFVIASKISCH